MCEGLNNVLKNILLTATIAVLPFSLKSQCIVADSVLPVCQGAAAVLTATLQAGCMNGTDSYTFEQFDFSPQPLVTDTAVDPDFVNDAGIHTGNNDDTWAGPYPIGFEFCFLNNVFTQYYIGSNGWITFTNPKGKGWTNYHPFTIPNTNSMVPKNAIFAPYQDWNPSSGGPNRSKVFRHIISDPPSNSKLVVYWDSCALFGCANALGIFQIVLNQSDYSIENNITQKPYCSWQGNDATQGVHNSDGTVAFVAFNRNADSWTTSNESTRFVPNGITWYKDAYPGGTIVGYGAQDTVYPMAATNYYPVIQTCSGSSQYSHVNVRVLPSPTLTGSDTACLNSTLKYTTEPGMVNYNWTFTGGILAGGGTASSDSIMVTWNTIAGNHSVGIEYTDPVSGCTALTMVFKTVKVVSLPVPTIISGVTPVCPGDTGNLYTTQPGKLSYLWTASAGGVITAGGGINDNYAKITWNNPGASQAGVIYTDPATHCAAGTPGTFDVTVKSLPDVVFTPLNPSGKWCSQDTVRVNLSSTFSGAVFSWNASADPAKVIPSTITGRNGNIIQPFQNTGTNMENVYFQVKATANGCTSGPYPDTIQIYPVPDVLVTPPSQYICSGGSTAPVSLSSSVAGTVFNWSYPCGSGFITPCPGSGSGSTIQPLTLSNSVNIENSTIITVMPSVDGCQGTSNTHTVTVNPKPSLTNTPLSQNACLGLPTVQVNFTCSVNPASYQWTASPSSPSITGYPSGSQNTAFIPVQTLMDPSNQTGFVTYAITPGMVMNQLSCYGDITNYIINTRPSPDVTITGPVPALACEGQSSAFSVPAQAGGSFTWSVMPASIGTLTSQQGISGATFLWNGSSSSVQVLVSGISGYGCTANGSSSFFIIRPKPAVSFTSCIDPVTTPDAKPYILKGGQPFGTTGSYTGTGVSYNSGQYLFDPSAVPLPLPKTVTLTYTYINMYGCPGSDVSGIQVVPTPVFQCGNPMEPLQDVRTTPYRQYTTYQRGGHCWMTENLDYGTSVSYMQSQTDNCIPEKYCGATDPSCTLLGGFYQWDELMQYSATEGAQGLCPPGWHVPSVTEWQSLIDDPANGGNGLAGGFLKDVPFIAKTGGVLYLNSVWAFTPVDDLTATMFWTSTSSGATRAYARGMNTPNTSVSVYSGSLSNAFVVRCVKDL
jgi:uncharacterized protein (TIGR02145 family)